MSFFSFFSPVLFQSIFNSFDDDDEDINYIMIREEEWKTQVNLNFKKDFEKYFKDQNKSNQKSITQDLFQIEPFYIEETTNLINLIIEGEN